MLFVARAEARRVWTLRGPELVLSLALFTVGCTEQVIRDGGNAGSSARAADGGGEPDADGGSRGAVGGQSGAAEGGISGDTNHDGQQPPEPDVVEPDVVEPDVVEPDVVEPDVVEPDGDPAGLPCDVEMVLRARCQSCHSRPPSGGATLSLLTYADLVAPSLNQPSVTVAAHSLRRMNDSLAPMPPPPARQASSAELATLRAWLEAGTPPGVCDPREEPNESSPGPYDAAPTCTSGDYWTGNDSGSPWMMPGRACITCHRGTNGRAPRFTVAGSVFPTAHEPDKCYGVPATTGAAVIITDANGQELAPIRVTSGGNFFATIGNLALPYRARVVVGNTERVMLTPQTDGDCNRCHTQAGANGALGRIILP